MARSGVADGADELGGGHRHAVEVDPVEPPGDVETGLTHGRRSPARWSARGTGSGRRADPAVTSSQSDRRSVLHHGRRRRRARSRRRPRAHRIDRPDVPPAGPRRPPPTRPWPARRPTPGAPRPAARRSRVAPRRRRRRSSARTVPAATSVPVRWRCRAASASGSPLTDPPPCASGTSIANQPSSPAGFEVAPSDGSRCRRPGRARWRADTSMRAKRAAALRRSVCSAPSGRSVPTMVPVHLERRDQQTRLPLLSPSETTVRRPRAVRQVNGDFH